MNIAPRQQLAEHWTVQSFTVPEQPIVLSPGEHQLAVNVAAHRSRSGTLPEGKQKVLDALMLVLQTTTTLPWVSRLTLQTHVRDLLRHLKSEPLPQHTGASQLTPALHELHARLVGTTRDQNSADQSSANQNSADQNSATHHVPHERSGTRVPLRAAPARDIPIPPSAHCKPGTRGRAAATRAPAPSNPHRTTVTTALRCAAAQQTPFRTDNHQIVTGSIRATAKSGPTFEIRGK